jgi:hypothetical protein
MFYQILNLQLVSQNTFNLSIDPPNSRQTMTYLMPTKGKN